MDLTVFVPNGDNRKETAVLLVGTADEYGIDQGSIRMVSGGFYITEELAAILQGEDSDAAPEPDPEPEADKPKATKKTSGNRAAKTGSKKKE